MLGTPWAVELLQLLKRCLEDLGVQEHQRVQSLTVGAGGEAPIDE
jgi:hypothetical protein